MEWETIRVTDITAADSSGSRSHGPHRLVSRAETTAPDGAIITAEIKQIRGGYHLLVSERKDPPEDTPTEVTLVNHLHSLAAGSEEEARQHAEQFIAELLSKTAAEPARTEA